MDAADLAGATLRPVEFEPTSQKWAGQRCAGFQLHVTEPYAFRPYRTSLRLLQIIARLYPKDFRWKSPPYEYEFEKRPIDLILGDRAVRRSLERQTSLASLEAKWKPALAAYEALIQPLRIYP